MITLSNDYHGTAIQTTKRDGDKVSGRTERRWRKELCGVHGCQCSGHGGIRMATKMVIFSLTETLVGAFGDERMFFLNKHNQF